MEEVRPLGQENILDLGIKQAKQHAVKNTRLIVNIG